MTVSALNQTPAAGPAPIPASLAAPAPQAPRHFEALLGAHRWALVPPPVRARFEKHPGEGEAVTYQGCTSVFRLNWAGWLLIQSTRLLGAPLPLERTLGKTAFVTVTEDAKGGGQVWSRLYVRKGGFPQVIHSAKRFTGPTGLEEYISRFIGIAERLENTPTGIAFIGDHYFLKFGRIRLRIPNWLAPGNLRVDHCDCGGGEFEFTLMLNHPLMGKMIYQKCRFADGAINMGARP